MANREAQGIKLFGKTITLYGTQAIKKEEHIQHHQQQQQQQQQQINGSIKPDPTAEKRPDKIIPCPRCKSMETKFCYFNNYNVNQPRHFCKGCQRYWTAGGALRNVPVGAGRRKSKPPGRVGEILGVAEMYGSGGVHQVDLEGLKLVEEWQAAVAATGHGGFRHVFPMKRPRCYSDGQSC